MPQRFAGEIAVGPGRFGLLCSRWPPPFVPTPTPAMSSLDTRPSFPSIPERSRIWLVDDSPLEREMARRLLSEQYEVEVFADGPPVLERLAAGERPDVLVLDWHMPQMSGLEVCRFLRERFDEASLPILVLTATGGQDDLLEGLAAGANDFVTKAFDPAELRARVGTLARGRLLYDSLKKTELATRRAREAADEANRAKDVFLATVSHELRTPLNSILGWARLLSEGTLDRETLARGLATIQRNAQIQVQLIEDILDTTRAISGKLHLELSTLDLAHVARAAFDGVKPSADAKQLELQLLVPEETLRVRGDSDRLQQAVGNLLANAVKFTPVGGSIRVELSQLRAVRQRVGPRYGQGHRQAVFAARLRSLSTRGRRSHPPPFRARARAGSGAPHRGRARWVGQRAQRGRRTRSVVLDYFAERAKAELSYR